MTGSIKNRCNLASRILIESCSNPRIFRDYSPQPPATGRVVKKSLRLPGVFSPIRAETRLTKYGQR
jgi:hypothetical protein